MTQASSLSGKQVAIVGYGVEGKAAAEYFSDKGSIVTVCDSNPDTPTNDYQSVLGNNYLDTIGDFDLVVRSPSINPELLTQARNITSATRYFLNKAKGLKIGVTGSKGKGTTSTLIQKLLESIGQKTWLGGNIGVPAIEFIDNVTETDVTVLEMSSFQLIDCQESPDIAVCLMIEPDHLNWHKDMDEYISAKAKITLNQSEEDYFVCHPTNKNSQSIFKQSQAKKLVFNTSPNSRVEDEDIYFQDKPLIAISEVGLIGEHNLENITAALTVLEVFFQIKPEFATDENRLNIVETLKQFKGLEYRLEPVREFNGVMFYDDSFAAMPDAAIAGLKAFDQPVVAIVGGVDKNVELGDLAEAITTTKFTVLIGEIAEKLAGLLDELDFKNYEVVKGEMSDFVRVAVEKSEPGDVVVLEPGTSSFDMFKNYRQRGDMFKKEVSSL